MSPTEAATRDITTLIDEVAPYIVEARKRRVVAMKELTRQIVESARCDGDGRHESVAFSVRSPFSVEDVVEAFRFYACADVAAKCLEDRNDTVWEREVEVDGDVHVVGAADGVVEFEAEIIVTWRRL